ncbi:hypothetical protein [Streptomyces sp. NBC_00258]|uniref:hypothetical protein n=1 Tax=Streptomyces sp. NBC_00258 TaxID=2903642 RepID=UPI002E29C6E2|nr:hypothetical protein [Streptomyces sp. NBC_00258]
MSALDSRALTSLDCFGQRFSAPGRTRYTVGGPLAACVETDELPFSITVRRPDDNSAQRQHDVEVRHARGGFTVATPQLEIAAGDVVIWHAAAAGTPPYGVWGLDESDGTFSSAALRDAAFYGHVFGAAGEYAWQDANGGTACGVVRVRDVDSRDRKACERWREELKEGSIVAVEGGKVEPAELSVVVGQTVLFAVAGSEGLAITDASLIRLSQCPATSQPPA